MSNPLDIPSNSLGEQRPRQVQYEAHTSSGDSSDGSAGSWVGANTGGIGGGGGATRPTVPAVTIQVAVTDDTSKITDAWPTTNRHDDLASLFRAGTKKLSQLGLFGVAGFCAFGGERFGLVAVDPGVNLVADYRLEIHGRQVDVG